MANNKKKANNNSYCPRCKAYKQLGITACEGCCGRK